MKRIGWKGFALSLLGIALPGCGIGLCTDRCSAVVAPGIICPLHYLAVGPNPGVGVADAFCVAKYEMKNDGSGNPISQMAGTPWVDISRDDGGGTPTGPGAITRCRSLGAGYDLVSNAQWQAVAREIELAQSAGIFRNWSNGSTSGANALNRGHSDSVPASNLAASFDNDPCFGTANVDCANSAQPDFSQKRTHLLFSGEVIWDIAGNVMEWVKGDIAAGPPYEGANGNVSQQPWTFGLNHPEMWGPFGDYLSKSSGEYGGLGSGVLGFSGGAVIRGAEWSSGTSTGVFSANLFFAPWISSAAIGFRCVWVP